jgi:hypothetical protein
MRKRLSDQGTKEVDQRGIEPLTSPVRAVRKAFTTAYIDAHA